MQTKQEILVRISLAMVELFEVSPEAVTLEADLYNDLDIDSIDAVDLIVELRPYIGKKIGPDDFKSVRSVGDVVDAVYRLLNNE